MGSGAWRNLALGCQRRYCEVSLAEMASMALALLMVVGSCGGWGIFSDCMRDQLVVRTDPGLELGAGVGLDDIRRRDANVEAHDQAQRQRLALLQGGDWRKKGVENMLHKAKRETGIQEESKADTRSK